MTQVDVRTGVRGLVAAARSAMIHAHDACIAGETFQRGGFDESAAADVGYLLRESAKMLDEARKEVNARLDVLSSQLAQTIINRLKGGAGGEMTVRGELASATPDVGL